MKVGCTCCRRRWRAHWRTARNRCRPVWHSRRQPGSLLAHRFAPAVRDTVRYPTRVAGPTVIPVSSCGSSPDGCRSQASCIQPSRPGDTDDQRGQPGPLGSLRYGAGQCVRRSCRDMTGLAPWPGQSAPGRRSGRSGRAPRTGRGTPSCNHFARNRLGEAKPIYPIFP